MNKKIFRYEFTKLGVLLQLMLDFDNLYITILILLSIFSLSMPFLFSILIIDIIKNNYYLSNVLKGFYEHIQVFVKTFYTGLIIVFWFSVIAFYYFNSKFIYTDDLSVYS